MINSLILFNVLNRVSLCAYFNCIVNSNNIFYSFYYSGKCSIVTVKHYTIDDGIDLDCIWVAVGLLCLFRYGLLMDCCECYGCVLPGC